MNFVFPNIEGDFVDLVALLDDTTVDVLDALDNGAIRLSHSCTEEDQIEPLSFLGFACVVFDFAKGNESNLFVWGSDETSWIFRRDIPELIRVFHPDSEAVRSNSHRSYLDGIAYAISDDVANKIATDSRREKFLMRTFVHELDAEIHRWHEVVLKMVPHRNLRKLLADDRFRSISDYLTNQR